MDYDKLAAMVEEMKAREGQVRRDAHRPIFHFLAPANWMNDPNGLIQWKGEYHLFYQHNPNGAFWGTMHWGHARSRDLTHWEHLPLALAPDEGGCDKDGVFSGCCVDNGGVPTILYTGVRPQTQCVATGDGEMIRWTKHPANPVIARPPEGFPAGSFRDPCVWREGREWLMAVGSGDEAMNGAVLLYRSEDLVRWEYLHPLLRGEPGMPAPVGSARMWECPSFFALGGRHALIVSCIHRDREHQPALRVAYMIGEYRDRRFRPERFGTLDFGSDYYAPATFADDRGRRLMFGWVGCGRSPEAQVAAGWAGLMSLPDVLTLRPDGRLGIEPAEKVRSLRARRLDAGSLRGDRMEIDVTLPVRGEPVGLSLRASPDRSEETVLTYDPARQSLELSRERASLDASARRGVCGDRLELGAGESLRLRVFLDGCAVEVYANGTARLSSTVFPSRRDSLDVRVRGGMQRATAFEAWEMSSIWP